MKRQSKCYSGIGGQAVLEGVMMKNGEKYAVAVRKPDGKIAVEVENYQGVVKGNALKKIPFVRGTFNFIDSMALGMKSLNYAAAFYDEEEEAGGEKKGEKLLEGLVMVASFAIAIGLFMVLPYYLTSLLAGWLGSPALQAIAEGVIRIAIFLLYVVGISLMKDIRRLYSYHGAEHKCINCIERGRPLVTREIMRSSRLHKRCGTSFLFFVMIVSIVLFFFIRVEHVLLRVALRILLLPVVAGISYEIIRLAGRSDNWFVRILSAPGMLLQRLTTKEPDEQMVEVAIAAVEAVFDWKKYLLDTFGVDENGDYIGRDEDDGEDWLDEDDEWDPDAAYVGEDVPAEDEIPDAEDVDGVRSEAGDAAENVGAVEADVADTEPVTENAGAANADVTEAEPVTKNAGATSADVTEAEPVTENAGAANADTAPGSETVSGDDAES